MKLVPLFEGELRFDEATEVGFPTHGEDGDWLAYVEGDGAGSGARLAGELRWANRWAAHSSLASSTTEAPSLSGVELPAVMVPSAPPNTGLSLASFSVLESRRR